MQALKNFLFDVYTLYSHAFVGGLFALLEGIHIGNLHVETPVMAVLGTLGFLFLWYARRSWWTAKKVELRKKDGIVAVGFFVISLLFIFWAEKGWYLPQTPSWVISTTLGFIAGFFGVAFIFFLILIWIGIPTLVFYGVQAVWKVLPKLHTKRNESLLVGGVACLCVLHLVFGAYATFFGGNIAGSDYFVLHAAIQNTCLLDPRKAHCPHSVEEISYIEPEEYAARSKTAQLYYQYYPDKNEYVFMARYAPDKIAIFGNRLQRYTGSDYAEYDIDTLGKDHIINPPAFEGPWNQVREWDK